ncbi:MAG: glutamate-5-semialdehyde dehydrogenase [Sulfuricurvum sp.]|uniref:glutamate-5-semialdehyde dehydrogenase n=1 Tax=Sulfuricurvum sp. TaxID=2025608 RepID=UPI002631B25B|nr:glutamate-5-semialdehyde dehydrogenase [Sulfuricurvum sp.]MDD5161082.1 glutamate-5-semialdehyde dehydrogenase [Sulfuricurvum sp.]
MEHYLQQVKSSSRILLSISSQERNRILREMAEALRLNATDILNANTSDMKRADEENLPLALKERLMLDKKRIEAMAIAVEEIAALKDPVGRIIDGWVSEAGLKIEKVSVPIGVIGIIYESRPNVTTDAAALCFKSSNGCVLKGGKEAESSNTVIMQVLQEVLARNSLPKELIALLPDSTREGVAKFIQMDQYIDLIIPRGGETLIQFVSKNATMPVIKHDKGQCHLYVDKDANILEAITIAINAKVQRPSACNSIETLLIDKEIAKEVLPIFKNRFEENQTILKGCRLTREIVYVAEATEIDFNTEYSDNILSICIVDGVHGAIHHITKFGSGHSESIITENITTAEIFMNEIDASSVYVNASTRFTDGGMFGFGAEVGISTSKLHARGPMGIEGLTTYKYKVYGRGQIRQ